MKLKKSIIIWILSSLSTALIASTGYSSDIDTARDEHMALYIQNEASIIKRIESRILSTGKFELLRSDVQEGWGLPTSYWTNFELEKCDSESDKCTGNDGAGINLKVDLEKKQIILSNSLGSNANSSNKKIYELTKRTDEILVTTDYKLIKPFSSPLTLMYLTYKEASGNENNEFSSTAPSDTSKVWYKANGDGSYSIYQYDTTTDTWVSIGTTAGGASKISVSSESELFSIPCAVNAEGFVSSGGLVFPYICNASGHWDKLGGATAGSDGGFYGDTSIADMTKKLINSTGNSEGTASAINGEFPEVKVFKKKDNSVTGGYWIDDSNSFIITETVAALKTQDWPEGTTGYTYKSDNESYILKRMNVEGILTWVYQADGFSDVAINFNNIELTDGGYVFDAKNEKFFKRYSEVWVSNDLTTQLTGDSLARNAFTTVDPSYTYYTSSNDCTIEICNGTIGKGYYAGKKKDDMYTFYYANAGNRKNDLIDAIPRSSITEVYNNADTASLVNGIVYFKDTDTRGRVSYKDSNGVFYTQDGKAIPSSFMVDGHPNLPASKDSSTVAWSGDYIILTMLEAMNWTDAPNEVGVRTEGKDFLHQLGDGKDFWTDDWSSDGQEFASTIFTSLARASVPEVTHELRVYSRQLCSINANCPKDNGLEDRRTDSGMISEIDPQIKEWFWAGLDDCHVVINQLTDDLHAHVAVMPWGWSGD